MLELEVRRYVEPEDAGAADATAVVAAAREPSPPGSWKPQWQAKPGEAPAASAAVAETAAFAVSFDDDFGTRFDATAAPAASSRAAPPRAEGASASDALAFEQLQQLCVQSQEAQAALLVCCEAYQSEIANLEGELEDAALREVELEEALYEAEQHAPNGHAHAGGGAAELAEALAQADTLRKQNAALRADLREQAALLKQTQRPR